VAPVSAASRLLATQWVNDMGQIGKQLATVTVQSDWWSRINWTQVVGWTCSGLTVWTAGKFDVPADVQVYIVLLIQAVAGLVTIWFRRTTTTITPTAAEMLKIGGIS